MASHPLPVNLVQVIRLEHYTAHYATTLGHLNVGLDNAEEDEEVRLHGGRIHLLGDRKFRTLIGDANIAVGDIPDRVIDGSVEVPGVVGT